MTRADRRRGEAPPPPEPLRVPVPDSHTHLDLIGGDPEADIAAACAVGVDRLMQVGVDLESSRWAARLAREQPAVLAAVALHPNEAPRLAVPDLAAPDLAIPDLAVPDLGVLDEALRVVEGLAGDSRVRAIGETGLDYFRTGVDGRAAQEHSFRAHIAIARRTGKALMIHDRDAHADVLRVLDEEGAPDAVVMHCFSGDRDFAVECVRRGFVLSYAGTVTFKNAEQLREAARVTPPGQLLVETDAPYLTPMPHRGRPNAPYLIPLTVRSLAETTGRDLDELCADISSTAERVFGGWSP
jgi:TatD DNase family protein